ncbi:hypothetical protein N9795_00565 [Candidatus Pelagibacter sp.]|nr:hypothetical protein [Candidatus Pelagibacter sp.]
MALKGQSIRNGVTININGVKAEKILVIILSQDWNESQEKFFKKMLQQGGKCKINGNSFEIILKERTDIDSRGNRPVNLPPVPGERTF